MTREQVVERLCEAIAAGREQNGNYSFPSDCICTPHPEGWHYEYDEDFLRGLEAAVEAFAATYRKEP